MPPRKTRKKAALKTPPVQETKAEPVVAAAAPKPKSKLVLLPGGKIAGPDLANIARRSMQLQQQHKAPQSAGQQVDGYGRPIAPPAKVVVDYRLTMDDGTVLHAEGRHADVIAHYIDECQAICNGQGLAAYNGPPMNRYTGEQWAAREAGLVPAA